MVNPDINISRFNANVGSSSVERGKERSAEGVKPFEQVLRKQQGQERKQQPTTKRNADVKKFKDEKSDDDVVGLGEEETAPLSNVSNDTDEVDEEKSSLSFTKSRSAPTIIGTPLKSDSDKDSIGEEFASIDDPSHEAEDPPKNVFEMVSSKSKAPQKQHLLEHVASQQVSDELGSRAKVSTTNTFKNIEDTLDNTSSIKKKKSSLFDLSRDSSISKENVEQRRQMTDTHADLDKGKEEGFKDQRNLADVVRGVSVTDEHREKVGFTKDKPHKEFSTKIDVNYPTSIVIPVEHPMHGIPNIASTQAVQKVPITQDMRLLIEKLADQMQVITDSKETKTSVVLGENAGIFKGTEITITQHANAPDQFNIAFEKIGSQHAKDIIDFNQNTLKQAFEAKDKSIIIHQIVTTTTTIDQPLASQDARHSRDPNREQFGGDGGNKGNGNQQNPRQQQRRAFYG